jgi:hypothetical protein
MNETGENMLIEVSQVCKDKGHMFSLTHRRQIQIQIPTLSFIHINTECVSKSGTVRVS